MLAWKVEWIVLSDRDVVSMGMWRESLTPSSGFEGLPRERDMGWWVVWGIAGGWEAAQ